MTSTQIILSLLVTWVVILVPPMIIRFLILRRPIKLGMVLFIISLVFYMLNFMMVSFIGRDGTLDISILLGIWVCYDILKYRDKNQLIDEANNERKKLGYD